MIQETQLQDPQVTPAILAAGRLAQAARAVTTANLKNLAQRMERLEVALIAYEDELMLLSNKFLDEYTAGVLKK